MDKLDKLKGLLTMVNESLTRADFELAVKALMDFVKKIRETNTQEFQMMKVLLSSTMEKMKADQETVMKKMDKEMMAKCEKDMNKMYYEHEAMMSAMDKKMDEVKDGLDGMPGAKGDKGDAGKDGTEISPELIITKVRTLPEEDGWKIDDIYQLREELDKLKKLKGNLGGVGGLRPSPTGVETPVGDIDSVNTVYTVTFIPQYITLQGQILYDTHGYTLTSVNGVLTITMDEAPITNNILRSHY